MKSQTTKTKSTGKPDTKRLILKQAVELFNQDGVANVTTRHIAKELGISHGNLTYHFPGKKDILLAIHNGLYDGVENQLENLMFAPSELASPLETKTPADLNQLFKFILGFQERYRFYYAEMLEVTRLVPDIRERMTGNYLNRVETFAAALRKLQANGFLVKSFKEPTLTRVAETIVFINTLWMSQSRVYTDEKLINGERTLEMLWGLLEPYLSAKATAASRG